MKKQKLILVGGGGHAKACIDVIISCNAFDIIGYIDQSPTFDSRFNIPFLGNDEVITNYVGKASFLVTVGQLQRVDTRLRIFNKIKSAGGVLSTIIAQDAYVSPRASIEEGSIIMHGAIVQSDVKVGANCIINDRALIEHDSIVGDHVHISTGVLLNGNVEVKNSCFIGSGAVIIQGISIGENSVVGAGAVVTKNIGKGETFAGVPAKAISKAKRR